MKTYKNLPRKEWAAILERPHIDSSLINESVASILAAVRREGDAALIRFAAEFDKAEISDLRVSSEEIEQGAAAIDPALAKAIKAAAANIEKFHAAQRHSAVEVDIAPGIKCLQRSVPIPRVGLYVPGGSAPLFSSVLMLAIPARIAGCAEIVLCTPPNREGGINPAILFAAKLCGVTAVFKAGGAQAIGAMAYGTQTIPRVDKIFGPGNQYVTAAKQQVSLADTAIDMPAGPSEVLVMADDSANAAFVASDLLSQAEHGGDSQAILLTTSESLAAEVAQQVKIQLEQLSRSALATKSIDNSRIIIAQDTHTMIEIANFYAAEHLIISMRNAWNVAERITAAGSIFIGNYTPESAGDYASGTNHTLPTSGWARSFSGVNLDSFNRKITYQEITRAGLQTLAPIVETMALAEGLDAHCNAVRIRLK